MLRDGGKLQVGGAFLALQGRVAREGLAGARELKKRGIALEWLPPVAGDAGPVINEAFASGRIQFASYGDLPSADPECGGRAPRWSCPLGAARMSIFWCLNSQGPLDQGSQRQAHQPPPLAAVGNVVLEAGG